MCCKKKFSLTGNQRSGLKVKLQVAAVFSCILNQLHHTTKQREILKISSFQSSVYSTSSLQRCLERNFIESLEKSEATDEEEEGVAIIKKVNSVYLKRKEEV